MKFSQLIHNIADMLHSTCFLCLADIKITYENWNLQERHVEQSTILLIVNNMFRIWRFVLHVIMISCFYNWFLEKFKVRIFTYVLQDIKMEDRKTMKKIQIELIFMCVLYSAKGILKSKIKKCQRIVHTC